MLLQKYTLGACITLMKTKDLEVCKTNDRQTESEDQCQSQCSCTKCTTLLCSCLLATLSRCRWSWKWISCADAAQILVVHLKNDKTMQYHTIPQYHAILYHPIPHNTIYDTLQYHIISGNSNCSCITKVVHPKNDLTHPWPACGKEFVRRSFVIIFGHAHLQEQSAWMCYDSRKPKIWWELRDESFDQ